MNSSLNFAFPRYLTARDYSREGRDLINPKFHSKGYFHAINTNFLIAIEIEKDLLNFPIVRIKFLQISRLDEIIIIRISIVIRSAITIIIC